LWLLTDLTEDSTLVDGFLAQIHCLPCVPVNELAKDKLQSYVARCVNSANWRAVRYLMNV
jgi:hypothetical protein